MKKIVIMFMLSLQTVSIFQLKAYNKQQKKLLKAELRKKKLDKKRRAVLKGLLWTVRFVEDNDNFDFIFTDYITMLHELAQNKQDSFIRKVSTQLIQNGAHRSLKRLSIIFPKTLEAKWDFISVLPIFYKHKVNLRPFRRYYVSKLPASNAPYYDQSLEQAITTRNYDLLLDYFVGYSFVDWAYKTLPKGLFTLPHNNFQHVINQCMKLPLVHTVDNETGYHDQNYYITHIICGLTNYNEKSLQHNDFTKNVFNYLWKNFYHVRHTVEDVDLLGEYIQCLKIYGFKGHKKVQEAERYLLSLQHEDGSWRNPPEDDDDAYDIFHPVWTSTVGLHVHSRYA